MSRCMPIRPMESRKHWPMTSGPSWRTPQLPEGGYQSQDQCGDAPDISGLNKEQLQKVIDKLKDLQQRVTGLVARGEMLDDSLARVLDEGTGGHTMAQKQIAEGTPEQAERDVHDVLAGTATEEQRRVSRQHQSLARSRSRIAMRAGQCS